MRMVVVVIVVGVLVIQREVTSGRFQGRRAAAMPVIAATGGMVVPALLFVLLVGDGAAGRGWGVPMATDVAFAAAVIVLAGPAIAATTRVFLLMLAVADDIGAVIVMSLWYSADISWPRLLGAGAATIACGLLVRRTSTVLGVFAAVAAWLCMLDSGVHPPLIGVAIAAVVTTRATGPSERWRPGALWSSCRCSRSPTPGST